MLRRAMAGRGDDDEGPGSSLLPTFVARRDVDPRTRVRAPDDSLIEGDTRPDHDALDEDPSLEATYLQSRGKQPAFDSTRSLAPQDRPRGAPPARGPAHGGGTLSVTPHDAMVHDRVADAVPAPVSDTLVSLTDLAPRSRRTRTMVRVGLGAVAVVAVGLVVVLLARPPALPPLAPAPTAVLVQAPLGLAQAELSFLARALPLADAAIERAPVERAPVERAPVPVERAPEPAAARPSPEPARPRAAPRATESPRAAESKPAATTAPAATAAPAPPVAPPTTGPDATVSVVVRSGGSAVATELWVDGRAVGQTPLRFTLRPGRHTFEARGPRGSVTKVVDIAPGSTDKVVIELGAP